MNIREIINKIEILKIVVPILIAICTFVWFLLGAEQHKRIVCDLSQNTCKYYSLTASDVILGIATNGNHINKKLETPKLTFLISDITNVRYVTKTKYVKTQNDRKKKYSRKYSSRRHSNENYTIKKEAEYVAQIETKNNKVFKIKTCSLEEECRQITEKIRNNIKTLEPNVPKEIYSSN